MKIKKICKKISSISIKENMLKPKKIPIAPPKFEIKSIDVVFGDCVISVRCDVEK